MKNGSTAKLIVPTLQGTIAETRWNNEKDKKEFLLRWTDDKGNPCERWFLEDELEEVVATPAPAAEAPAAPVADQPTV